MNMTNRLVFSRRLTLGVLAPMLVASTVFAQKPTGDPRWEAWLGCWQSMSQATSTAPASAVVCVTPLSGSGVEVATLNAGKVVGRDTIETSGEKHAITAQGCTGWQRAEWSHDTRRVYLSSDVACGSSVTRTSSGVIAMTPGGDWLDIQSVSANGNSGVRTTRYREVGPWFADLPAEFAGVISARTRLPYAARALAGSEVGTRDVIEAVTRVDSLVVESWLAERGQKFDLDARKLIALADAGVPASVTDMMIGVSYPYRFAVARKGSDPVVESDTRGAAQGNGTSAMRGMQTRCMDVYDPMWFPQAGYDPCGSRYGNYGYGPYGYSPYGYGSYGYSPYYGTGYSTPIVIVRDNGKPEPPHGKVIKGQGYTRGNDGTVSNNPQRESSGSRGATQSGSSGRSSGSSSGSSSSGSSSGSSSSGRTAQARKGGGS
jgi:hypothetical protein